MKPGRYRVALIDLSLTQSDNAEELHSITVYADRAIARLSTDVTAKMLSRSKEEITGSTLRTKPPQSRDNAPL